MRKFAKKLKGIFCYQKFRLYLCQAFKGESGAIRDGQGIIMHEGMHPSVDGLVGYDTALTRQGSRVRAPVHVVFFIFTALSR